MTYVAPRYVGMIDSQLTRGVRGKRNLGGGQFAKFLCQEPTYNQASRYVSNSY